MKRQSERYQCTGRFSIALISHVRTPCCSESISSHFIPSSHLIPSHLISSFHHLISLISSHHLMSISSHLISSHLTSSDLISSNLIISSHLISSVHHLISSHLIFIFISISISSHHPISSHVISSHFTRSHLISSRLVSSHHLLVLHHTSSLRVRCQRVVHNVWCHVHCL